MKIKKKKRENKIILILFVILCILIGKLIMSSGNQDNSEARINASDMVWNSAAQLQLFATMENEIELGQQETAREQPAYAKLYPELYAEPLKKQESSAEDKKIAYLTFDDGPSARTCDVLEVLEKQNVKATFFIVGETMTTEGKECLKQMTEQGHTIGLHTYSHDYKKLYSSVETFLEDYNKIYTMIKETTGVEVNIFRFPGGSNNPYVKKIREEVIQEMERRGFTYYDWNVSAEDSVGKPTSSSIKSNIKKDVFRFQRPVILMHDSQNNLLTVKLLPEIIESIRSEGYEFDTVDNREPCQFKN